MVRPCIWFKEEPFQFSMGQTAQSPTCSIIEKPHTGLDECPRILLLCLRARNSIATWEIKFTWEKNGNSSGYFVPLFVGLGCNQFRDKKWMMRERGCANDGAEGIFPFPFRISPSLFLLEVARFPKNMNCEPQFLKSLAPYPSGMIPQKQEL